VHKKSRVASEKRRHAIAGMIFSLSVAVLIAARDAGLVHWNTPEAQRISVVKTHVIVTVKGVVVWWKSSRRF
jgi:hypothetical protein